MRKEMGWMGFFILMILVIAFSFIIIGVNSQNAANARQPQDGTELPGYTDYSNKTAKQAGTLDLMFFRILMYVIVFILILFAAAIFIKNIIKRRKGMGGTGT